MGFSARSLDVIRTAFADPNVGAEIIAAISSGGGGGSSEAAYNVPILANYTWVNQGTATANDATKGIYLDAPAVAQYQLRGLVIPTGPTPWSYVAKIIPAIINTGSIGGAAGIFLTNSTNGQVVTMRWTGATGLDIISWTSVNSPNAGMLSTRVIQVGSNLNWMRVTDDGTNRNYYISADGANWILLFTAASTTPTTMDRVGFYVDPYSAGYSAGAKLASAKLN